MRKPILIAIVLGIVVLLSGLYFACDKSPRTAKAEFINAEGQIVGHADLIEETEGVKISFHLTDLPPGKHGLHIHEVGRAEPPDFKSAGGHFNPEGKQHGHMNPTGFHAGDLPNIEVGKDGKLDVEILAKGVTLRRRSRFALLRWGGTSIVIHADVDDEKTDPSGNSGPRIACGVITR